MEGRAGRGSGGGLHCTVQNYIPSSGKANACQLSRINCAVIYLSLKLGPTGTSQISHHFHQTVKQKQEVLASSFDVTRTAKKTKPLPSIGKGYIYMHTETDKKKFMKYAIKKGTSATIYKPKFLFSN